MNDAVVKARLDDLLVLLGPHGYGASRTEVVRRAVFALPTEDEEHLARLLQFGGLRYREASGLTWSEDALAQCEGLLGWWNENAELAALVRELDDCRGRLATCARRGEAIADYARGGRYQFC